MPHIYRDAQSLQGHAPVDGGQCVALVQHFTDVGHTSTWRQGEHVMDKWDIPAGTVIATFENGKYPNRAHGNHAALYLYSGPVDPKTKKPAYIVVMDQWKNKPRVSSRPIYPRKKSNQHGGLFEDSNNADAYYIVK